MILRRSETQSSSFRSSAGILAGILKLARTKQLFWFQGAPMARPYLNERRTVSMNSYLALEARAFPPAFAPASTA